MLGQNNGMQIKSKFRQQEKTSNPQTNNPNMAGNTNFAMHQNQI